MKCDVCGSDRGVSIIHGVLPEGESAGVRRLCAACNVKAAKYIRGLGLFTHEDRQAYDRKRKFVDYLRGQKAKHKVKA